MHFKRVEYFLVGKTEGLVGILEHLVGKKVSLVGIVIIRCTLVG